MGVAKHQTQCNDQHFTFLPLKQPGKEEHTQFRRNKGQSRNKWDKKQEKKISDKESWCFESITEIDKPLASLKKKKKEGPNQ